MTNTVKISDAASSLLSNGILSSETAARLSRLDRETEVSILAGFENPVYSLFLIDASGSMKPYRDAVIEGQRQVLIPSLRQSYKCRKRGLHVAQTLFSHEVKILNQAARLNPEGNDKVALLDHATYDPQRSDRTALYQTVFYGLQEMAAIVYKSREKNIPARFTIGVITDGKDTQGGVAPQEIQQAVAEFQNGKFLKMSVLIGAVGPDFTPDDLEEMRARLGFQMAISLARTPQEIRRAFALASQASQSAF